MCPAAAPARISCTGSPARAPPSGLTLTGALDRQHQVSHSFAKCHIKAVHCPGIPPMMLIGSMKSNCRFMCRYTEAVLGAHLAAERQGGTRLARSQGGPEAHSRQRDGGRCRERGQGHGCGARGRRPARLGPGNLPRRCDSVLCIPQSQPMADVLLPLRRSPVGDKKCVCSSDVWHECRLACGKAPHI